MEIQLHFLISMGKIKAKSSPELNIMLEEIEGSGYVSLLVISNERLVRVMLDVNRLTLSIYLHRFLKFCFSFIKNVHIFPAAL